MSFMDVSGRVATDADTQRIAAGSSDLSVQTTNHSDLHFVVTRVQNLLKAGATGQIREIDRPPHGVDVELARVSHDGPGDAEVSSTPLNRWLLAHGTD
jgi:hypothetical protein